LDHVQSVAVWMPSPIEPSFVVEVGRVDDERICVPTANRVSHPGGGQILVMCSPIGIDLARKVIELEEHDDSAGDLNDLHGKGVEIDPWHAGRITPDVSR